MPGMLRSLSPTPMSGLTYMKSETSEVEGGEGVLSVEQPRTVGWQDLALPFWIACMAECSSRGAVGRLPSIDCQRPIYDSRTTGRVAPTSEQLYTV